jgi:hypothetical protein
MFYRPMILLNSSVEVATALHQRIFPLRILPSQEPHPLMTRRVTIERHLARPSRQARRQSVPAVRLRGGDAAIRTKQEVHCLAVLVHGAIEVMPLASNTDVGVSRPGHCSPSPSQNRTGTSRLIRLPSSSRRGEPPLPVNKRPWCAFGQTPKRVRRTDHPMRQPLVLALHPTHQVAVYLSP